MAARCEKIAAVIAEEAGVETVVFNKHGSLTGNAHFKTRTIRVPRPRTRRALYTYAHECGHVALAHESGRSIPSHRIEYEAERWAHEALSRHKIAVPKKQSERAKEYVARKIHQAVRRGAKSIDKEALDWCYEKISATVVEWLRANPGGLRALGNSKPKKVQAKAARQSRQNMRAKNSND